MRNILIFCSILIGAQSLRAQAGSGGNPFEIAARLPQSTAPEGRVSSNPFDVVPHIPPGAGSQNVRNISEAIKTADDWVPHLPKGDKLPKFFMLTCILLCTAFFTFAVTANRGALLKAWRSFLSTNSMNLAQREAAGFVGSRPYYLMYASFLLQAGVFIFLILQAFNADDIYNNFWAFLLCMLASPLFFLSKHVLLNIVKWLFPSVGNEVDRYNFLIIIFNCVLGFFLLPFNFLIAFAASDDNRLFMALWTLALAAIFIAYRSFRGVGLGTKILSGNQFHFLLYLCTAEVAPALILLKFFIP